MIRSLRQRQATVSLHACLQLAQALTAVALLAVGASAAAADNDISEKINSSGLTRDYVVHLPPGLSADHPAPLVINLHGGGGQAKAAMKQTHFSDVGDSAGAIVVYPNGTSKERPMLAAMGKRFLTWNAGTCCDYAAAHNIDDVSFIRAMVAQLETEYPIDRKRIYATGISNGAMMSYRLACEASDIFAAVGIVSGAMLAPTCAPQYPVSVIHIHGTADQNVPFNGGYGSKSLNHYDAPPARTSVGFWVKRDHCASAPDSTITGDITHEVYKCPQGLGVEFYILDGWGHSWPGGDRMMAMLDAPNMEIDASQIMWQFFATHPKP